MAPSLISILQLKQKNQIRFDTLNFPLGLTSHMKRPEDWAESDCRARIFSSDPESSTMTPGRGNICFLVVARGTNLENSVCRLQYIC